MQKYSINKVGFLFGREQEVTIQREVILILPESGGDFDFIGIIKKSTFSLSLDVAEVIVAFRGIGNKKSERMVTVKA